MTEPRPEDVLRVISDTKLPPTPHTPDNKQRSPATSNQRTAYTNRGSLQAFDEKLEGQSKDDALYWTLFAQLAADAQFDRQTRAKDWYQFYLNTLVGMGMTAHEDKWTVIPESQLKSTVSQTLLELIKTFVTEEDYRLIIDVINALSSGSANQPLKLFNRDASNSSNGNFQVTTSKTDGDRRLIITIGFFFFSTTQTITNMLFWKWTNNRVSFTKGDGTLSLSRTLADQTRDALIKKLGGHIVDNIEDIPLV